MWFISVLKFRFISNSADTISIVVCSVICYASRKGYSFFVFRLANISSISILTSPTERLAKLLIAWYRLTS